MKKEDETVFEYFQRGEIEYLEAMNDVLSERVEFLETLSSKILSYEYIVLLEREDKIINDYRFFLENFNGIEMFLEELNKATNITPRTKK
ncbi:hypothetical protein [Pseudomonas sp. FSL R10-1339]|uniref:hypothetical protein n=1 Tax=Pseudomonas sp. FSL R10-1339 TaxID=2662196 RepID=UPI001294C158|nr:hypothetical protein [Pseudomonas sp. FSL R10-1339]MQU55622.1 hypothetical protein [Pseudomonas sp. FSL R10-1339]